jgi:hypothetical protein
VRAAESRVREEQAGKGKRELTGKCQLGKRARNEPANLRRDHISREASAHRNVRTKKERAMQGQRRKEKKRHEK